jgi:putative hydrolase of the HAD superfamily
MKYRHLFFDLDHTLWDFESNCRVTLEELYFRLELESKGVNDFTRFYEIYLVHNEKFWERYRNGSIKVDELRWKRMWHTLIDFQIGDELLAKQMSAHFLELLPTRKLLFPDTIDVLQYLTEKGLQLHLITNGFEETQRSKLKYSGLHTFFVQVITSECSNSLKPNKEIFDYALEKTGALKENSIMIGDSIEVDIIGAMNAGIDQVHVNHTNIKTKVRPTYTVYSLKELKNIF